MRHSYSPPGPATKVEHRFVRVSHESKVDALVAELRADRELALIFVRTKRGADRLVKRLASNGVQAVAMHGNKSQNQRERSLASFDSGKVDALVATDVAARGIDVDGISHVINFDPPGDSDAYLHRVGRTARAGRSGVGVTFVKGEEAARRRHDRPPAEPARAVRRDRPCDRERCSRRIAPRKWRTADATTAAVARTAEAAPSAFTRAHAAGASPLAGARR